MNTQSATMTEQERMKLIKWAKKNGAARIAIEGVEIEFQGQPKAQRLESDFPLFSNAEIDRNAKLAIEALVPPESSESSKKAMAALRSRMDDPDVFAHQSDEWANQTRLPR